MTQREFEFWKAFYERYPFDDLHMFHRPAALISQSMTGGDMSQKIEWLSSPIVRDLSDADLRTLKAFGLKPQG